MNYSHGMDINKGQVNKNIKRLDSRRQRTIANKENPLRLVHFSNPNFLFLCDFLSSCSGYFHMISVKVCLYFQSEFFFKFRFLFSHLNVFL